MKTKRLLVSLLTMLAAICMAFSVVMLSTTVKATSFTEESISTGTFTVLDGASARTQKGTSGIRYIVQMSPDFYESVASKEGVKFGGILAKDVANTAAITLDTVDGTSIKDVAWAAPNGNQWGTTPTTINPTAIDVEEDGNVDYYQYNLVVSFGTDGRTEADLAILYATNYNVRAYVSYTEGGQGKVIYSNADANTNRNLTAVAETVLLEDALNANVYSQDEMAEARAILVEYANSINQIFPISEQGYIVDFSQNDEKTFTGVDVPNGEYQASLNGSDYITVSVEDGSFTLPQLPEGLRLGSAYIGVLKQEGGLSYAQSFQYVSKIITTADEFVDYLTYYNVANISEGGLATDTDVSKYYNGATYTQRYYVLGANITLPYWGGDYYAVASVDNARGVFDVLDGKGYKVVASTEMTGLFNSIGQNAVIKNIELDITQAANAWLTGATDRRLALARYMNESAKVENTYIKYSCPGTSVINNLSLVQCGVWSLHFSDIYLNMDIPAPTQASSRYGFIQINSDSWVTDGQYSNFYALSPVIKEAAHLSDQHIQASNTSLENCAEHNNAAYQKANGIFQYDTVEDLRAATTKVGDWAINADGTATWSAGVSGAEELNEYVSKNTSEEKYAAPIVLDEVAYIEQFSQSDTPYVQGLFVEDATYNVSINGETYEEVWVEGGVLYIEGESALTFGQVYQIYFENLDGGDNYVQNAKYVSQIIDTAEELKTALTYYNSNRTGGLSTFTGMAEDTDTSKYFDGATFSPRYYVLDTDITYNSSWVDETGPSYEGSLYESMNNNTRIWNDVLDGQGHSITNTWMYGSGFFRLVGSNGVIKNLKLNLKSDNGDAWALNQNAEEGPTEARVMIAAKVLEGAKLENLYLTMSSTSSSARYGWQGIVFTGENFTINNVVMKYDDSVVSKDNSENHAFGYLGGELDAATVDVNNYVAISANVAVAQDGLKVDNKYVASNQTEAGYTSLEGVYYFDNIANATITNVGSWSIDGVWMGDKMTASIVVGIGDVVELGDAGDLTFIAQGSAVEVVNGYAIAKTTGTSVITVEGMVGEMIITVIDKANGFTATADDSIAVDGTTSITIADANGKEYVGNVVYATDVNGVVSIASDGTITGVAAGTVNVKVAINIGGSIKTLTVAITVA